MRRANDGRHTASGRGSGKHLGTFDNGLMSEASDIVHQAAKDNAPELPVGRGRDVSEKRRDDRMPKIIPMIRPGETTLLLPR